MLTLKNFTGATSFSSLTSLSSHDHRFSHRLPSKLPVASSWRVSCSTLRVQELSMEEPLDSKPIIKELLKPTERDDNDSSSSGQEEEEEEEEDNEEEEEDKKGISRINVSREKYIPVSKSELLEKIVSELFNSQETADQFHELCSCLDSILHAEHKNVLEELRRDYNEEHRDDGKLGTSSNEKAMENSINGNGSMSGFGEEMKLDLPLNFDYGGLYLRNFLGSSMRNEKIHPNGKSRLVVASRFQRAFMQLLNNAQFQELSARDLMLTSALNSDYLLTLPIYVDWKKASESNAIIFRRGYATERQKGLMLVEKLDYVQSRLLRAILLLISRPLGKVGLWMKKSVRNAIETPEVQDWIKELEPWLERLSLLQQSYFNNEKASDSPLEIDQLSDTDLPIWLAAQRAVNRYEGFLSPVGPRGRLLRRLLTWIGAISPTEEEKPFEVDNDGTVSEPHLGPIFLSRISLSDIWRPATRKFRRNNFWKKLKASFSIFLSQSELQEPAFQELILLYTEEMKENGAKDNAGIPSLQLKIYEKIPIPELPVVFPHKKLSFRIIDTVRLDAATILGLSAYFINYKFESISSSPSAIFLDVIATTALIISVSRVVLGYKQTWDRYQLLVNRTLYEKTLASGFGSVHFLLDASEQQQYKEAILTYAVLLKAKDGQVSCPQRVGDECERFLYKKFNVKVEMPLDKALNTLTRLGLVTEAHIDGIIRFQAIPCREAHEALRERWNNLLR